jgi:DNA-binding CsgD family transcriptional regulator
MFYRGEPRGARTKKARLRTEQYRGAKNLDLKVNQQSKALVSLTNELKKKDAAQSSGRGATPGRGSALPRGPSCNRSGALEESELLELQRRYVRLTPRERDVLPFVVAGTLSKQTARDLGTSEITTRVPRRQIMHKMQEQSLADLIRMLTIPGFSKHPVFQGLMRKTINDSGTVPRRSLPHVTFRLIAASGHSLHFDLGALPAKFSRHGLPQESIVDSPGYTSK